MPVTDTPKAVKMKELRAALLMRGLTLSSWGQEIGVHRQNVSRALSGDWKGPKANRVVELAHAEVEGLKNAR